MGTFCQLILVAGHCFTIAETTQTFTNANFRHNNIMFKPQVIIFVKAWVVSVRVKEWFATLTCNLQPATCTLHPNRSSTSLGILL